MNEYADIISLPQYELQNHRPMPLQARAAQFAPFAALTGFDDEIEETARLTDAMQPLTEDEAEALNQELVWLLEHEAEHPEITVTYFQSDQMKQGGSYVTFTGNLRFLDEAEGKLKFTDGSAVQIGMIRTIRKATMPEQT